MSATISIDNARLTACAHEIADAGRELAALGWTPATSSNFSMRLGDDQVAVTISGRDKGRLSTDDIMVVDFHSRPITNARPSAETALHTQIYRRFPSAQAVLHTHSHVAYGLTMQELERGDSGLRSFASVQGALCMYPIFEYGSEEQRQQWLPRMAKGEVIGCFGLTEPDFGSDPGGMITRAKKTKGGWILNGAKMWITNGTVADIAIVWARGLDEASGKERIMGFIVEKDFKGFSAPEQKRKHSLRASVTSELILQDVFVPDSHVLPNGIGLKAPLGCLTQARFGIAFGVVGAAMACFESATEYSKSRIMFGKPIGSFQLVQAELAKMLTEIVKAQLLALQCGRMKERGVCKPEHVSMAKRNNCEIALDVARRARDIHGANGITSEYPIMRHMCNLESVKTYEGTHNIHTLVLGETITGIAAYR